MRRIQVLNTAVLPVVPADVAEVAERYDGYTSAGVVHRFEVDGNDTTFSLLMRDEVKMAARRLALGQLRKGRGAFSRHHNDAFVDAIFAKWLQTSTIPAILRRCEPACATTGGRLGTRRDAEFGPAERSQSREAGVVEQEDNIGGPVQRHWRVFGTGPGREGCIATDWDGRVLAHEVTGPVKETFDRAVADFCTHDQLVSSLPAGALEPVTQSLNAPAGPLTRRMADDPSRKLATAIALDPFTSGTWLVETDSGSRYSFDLDYGAYARHPDVGGQAMEGDGEFAPIVEVLQWPSVNSGFVLIDQRTDPSTPENELRDEDVRERRLTSSWVTSIVEIPRDLWRAEPVTSSPWLLSTQSPKFPREMHGSSWAMSGRRWSRKTWRMARAWSGRAPSMFSVAIWRSFTTSRPRRRSLTSAALPRPRSSTRRQSILIHTHITGGRRSRVCGQCRPCPTHD